MIKKPDAWLHEQYQTTWVITDRIKELWLRVNPIVVRHYTIPLFLTGASEERPKEDSKEPMARTK